MCVISRVSKKHSEHKMRPFLEVADEHRKKLQEDLTAFEQVKENCGQAAGNMKIRTQRRRSESSLKSFAGFWKGKRRPDWLR